MQWTIDPAHSEVGFAVKHMMVTTVRGRFERFDADIAIDPEAPERSRVRATIDAASLNTGQADRDAHLKSPDFFDVERYRHITFESRPVERLGEDAFRVTGDLTIRDVTEEVVLNGEFAGPVPHVRGGQAIGFALTGEIDRERFGLTWNMPLATGGVLVGRTVKLAIETEVVQSESESEPAEAAA